MNIDFSSKYFLRDEVGGYMTTLGDEDSKVVVVNADLMRTCRNRSFAEKYPERTFNVGIAEQDMVSFAAGLAHEGFKSYAFTMAPFMSMRACEQVRTDVAYADLDVTLIGAYAGVSGGISGATHWGLEDVGIMTSFPNMTVMEPCDPVEAHKMMEASLSYSGPIYIRTSVEPTIPIYDENFDFQIGKASEILSGNDGTFIVSGITVKYALQAAMHIKETTGNEIRVIDMHTIKPIDSEAVINAAKTGHVVVAQDHNIHGGLGNAVSEVIVEEGIATKFRNIGYPDEFVAMAHAPYLYHKFGYDAEGLECAMLSLF